MDACPSCGELLSGRVLLQSVPAVRASGQPDRELRRCPACRHIAWRWKGAAGGWAEGRLDRSLDYLFDWQPELLPGPWAVAPAGERSALEAELLTEVADGHDLFGLPVVAIARCRSCDDAVFAAGSDPVRFVLVHLTWRRSQEQPPWPGPGRYHCRCHEAFVPTAMRLERHAPPGCGHVSFGTYWQPFAGRRRECALSPGSAAEAEAARGGFAGIRQASPLRLAGVYLAGRLGRVGLCAGAGRAVCDDRHHEMSGARSR